MSTITFTIPSIYADKMTSTTQHFYLDVFGNVRDTETLNKIGAWERYDND